MKTKILLLALSVAAFSSCSTAYKTGQTPDDVYYSPEKPIEVRTDNDRDQQQSHQAVDYEITMGIRDYRWRDFREDYNYDNSPYNYTCKNYSYGYYYNPYYYPWAIYNVKTTSAKPVNTTPRMVNLNAYNGYYKNVAVAKTTGAISWSDHSAQYNNSNRSSSKTEVRRLFIPLGNSSNDTRSYTPSSNSSFGSGGGSSSGGGGGGGGSVSRPGRGG